MKLRPVVKARDGVSQSWIASAWARYGLAVVAVLAALLLRQGLAIQFGEGIPTYVTFYTAVMIVALIAGFRPGILATGLSVAAVDYWIVCPKQLFIRGDPGEAIGIILFTAMGVLVCLMTDAYHQARQRAAAYEKDRILRQGQEALLEHGRRYDLALKAGNLGTWDYDFISGEVCWDERCRRMFGVAVADHIDYQAVINTIHEADRVGVDRAVQEALKPGSKGAYRREYRVVWPDGSIHWVAAVGQVHFEGEGEQGRPCRFIGTVRDITEAKAAEEALREREAQFRAIFEVASIGIVQVEPNSGRCLRFNDKYCEITGYSPEELRTISLRQLTRPDDWDSDSHLFNQFASGQIRNYRNETRFVRKDGTVIWVRLNAGMIRELSGEPVCAVVVCEDITDRKLTEEALSQSRADLSRAQSVAHVGGWRLNVERDELLWSEETYRIFGLAPGSPMTYEKFLGTIHPADHNYVHSKWMAALRGEPYDIEHRILVAGDVKWVRERAELEFSPEGKLVEAFGIAQDITERKLAEAALRNSEEELRLVLEFSNDAVFWADADTGVLIRCNRKGEELTERSRDELVGMHQSQLHPADEDCREVFRKAARVSESGNIEAELLSKSGKRTPVLINTTVITLGGRRIIQGVFRDISARRQAEQALREQERRWRQLAEAMPNLVWTCTPDGDCDFLSQQWVAYTGRSESEQLGYGWVQQVHPDDREALNATWKRAVLTGGLFDIEFRIRRYDGVYRWFKTRAVPIRGQDGRVIKWYGSNTDIHDFREVHEALRESEMRFRTLFEQAAVGVAQIDDKTGRFIRVNNKYAAILGYSPEEMQQFTFQQLLHPQDASGNGENLRRLLGGELSEYSMERRCLHKRGAVVWVNLTVSPMSGPGEPSEFHIAVAQDITDRKWAEEALAQANAQLEQEVEKRTAELRETNETLRSEVRIRREAEEKIKAAEFRYRTVANFTHDWEYWRSAAGALLYCSPSCERITGWTAEELTASPHLLDELVHPEDREAWRAHQNEAVTRQGLLTLQFRLVSKDGAIRWLEHVCNPVLGPAGEYLGVRASNRDITDRQRAELETQRLREELGRVSRVSMAGQLAAAIAHELNQPLGAILCNAQSAEKLLKLEPPDLAEALEALQDIRSDSQRAGAVIQHLRSLFQSNSQNRAPVKLNDILQRTLKMMNSEFVLKSITVRLDLDPSLPTVLGNAIELQQVILNLILNALDAMSRCEPGNRRLSVSTSQAAEFALCSISDTGPGIDPEKLRRIFEPFFSTKAKGMGMGLAISHAIIEAHGGRLWAQNASGGGATFQFTLSTTERKPV